MTIYQVFIVGLGGFIGASLRYIISMLSLRWFGNVFPYGTLFVNILGCILVGFIMELSRELWPISSNIRIFLTVGILGGLTTFSTFTYETMDMVTKGNYLSGMINIILNLVLCIVGIMLGKYFAQII